ncbi:TMhelix containing protein [Vibrio phage 1.077.O._10N.261.45.A10]|nr:TMhelix containing protein [Vibrio phage 1.070.O._10N.261.45.B2]AUR85639.1 TMhelix containing protein [Vibrio phage 1.077.O._10N.261.45.A10]
MIKLAIFLLFFTCGLALAGLFVGTVGVITSLGIVLSFGMAYPEIAAVSAHIIPFTGVALPVLFPVLGIYALRR